MNYQVLDDPSALAHAGADLIEAEVGRSSSFLLGLAGGSTPARTYQDLASRQIDWSTTTAWLTDERWVEPTHRDANQKMVRHELIEPTGIRFLAPNTKLASPKEAAADYANSLAALLEPGVRTLTMLGIGADGHTASLFPDSDALRVVGETYVANYAPSLESWRLTATFDLIASTDIVLFLVSGSSKAEMISAIQAGADVPAGQVRAKESVLWLLDKEAASAL